MKSDDDTSTPEAEVIAKAIVEPTPTNKPPKPEPTRPPTSKVSPTEEWRPQELFAKNLIVIYHIVYELL